jgi:hypothetical protein
MGQKLKPRKAVRRLPKPASEPRNEKPKPPKILTPSPKMLESMRHYAALHNFNRDEVDQLCRKLGVSEITQRAIHVAKPRRVPPMTWERWLHEFDAHVAWLKRHRSKPPLSPAEKRERLKQAASALAKAESLLRAFLPSYRDLREAVNRARETAKGYASRVKVPRSGGPRDRYTHIKEYVANYAFDLLNDYGRTAPLTTGGAYFELASIMFEAVTRREGASIVTQCRAQVARMRKELGDPAAFRVRRKRTGRF